MQASRETADAMRTPYGAAQYMRARHLRPGDRLALSLLLALLVQKYTYGLKRPLERHLRAGDALVISMRDMHFTCFPGVPEKRKTTDAAAARR